MIRRLVRVLPMVLALIGVVLVWSGVSMMEQTATADAALYPYIARTFAGLALMGVAVTVCNAREGARK